MDTLKKLFLTITLASLISIFIVFEQEISPWYIQHMRSSKQESPRPVLHNVSQLYMNLRKPSQEQK